ncbi:MAG: 6-pyruvoyl-tetrahydropterin synthase-related protein, partial [Alistipes sp.]|nr:6-pyruvoyl-tetrahydropterin synthase-related protein [Alistipes sp.]
DLLQYDKIYLSNFKYDNLAHAEEMVRALSDAGVKVCIDCTHMPINVMAISEFLGVESRFISISQFDTIRYGEAQARVELPYEWYAAYLVPAKDDGFVEYTYSYGTQVIDYLVEKDNISFVGLNLVYLYYENESEELLKLLDAVFDITEEDRHVAEEIVPIRLQYGTNRIMIETEKQVNTTIAFQDNFRSERELICENNMLVAGEGITVISIYYKYLLPGFLCSIAGYAFMLAVYWKIELKTGGRS